MRYLWGVIVALMLATPVSAQLGHSDYLRELGTVQPIGEPRIKEIKSAQSEAKDAVLFLDKVHPEDAPFIKVFTTYAVPDELREKTVLQLSYVIHSLVGVNPRGSAGAYYPLAKMEDGKFVPVQKVPGSDTLWYIDVRNYNWTIRAWEQIMKEDPYFVEPAVDSDVSAALRLLSGNSLARADWFVRAATDAQLQADAQIPFTVYETLLYANLRRPPKNLAEFRKVWGVNYDFANRVGARSGALVTESGRVARNNRILEYYNSSFGWYYETWDVFNMRGLRDYMEAFPSYIAGRKIPRDGGEAFASNGLNLQVYVLYAGNNNGNNPNGSEALANTADAGLARHMGDVINDARVNNARSCFDCHSNGPIRAQNAIAEFGGRILFPTKELALKADREFLSDKFDDDVKANQGRFAAAVKKVNGLEPGENQSQFLEVIRWYNKGVDINQAAKELGLSVDTLRLKLREVDILPGRLALLLQNNSSTIPRDIWDSPGKDGVPGIYQQALIAVHGLTVVETDKEEVIRKTFITPTISVKLQKKGHNTVHIKAGTQLEYIRELEHLGHDWIEVKHNNETFFILRDEWK